MGHILLYLYDTSLCKDKKNETDLVRQCIKLKIKYDKIKEAVQGFDKSGSFYSVFVQIQWYKLFS